jgi:uncharacterized membrane protein YgcG
VRCPACQTAVFENDAACRQCGFSLDAADHALGVPPTLQKPLTDPKGLVPSLARRRLLRAVSHFEHRYPQVEIAVVVLEVPPQVPAGVYAFWLFNRGQLSSAVETAGDNHLVMLLIEAASERAVVMAGYGLEPFVQANQLQMCLNRYSQAARRGSLVDGALAFLEELDVQFKTVLHQLPRQFGLADEEMWTGMAAGATDDTALRGAAF